MLTRVNAVAILWSKQRAQRLAGGDDGGFAARDLLEVHLKPAHPTGPGRLHAARCEHESRFWWWAVTLTCDRSTM